MRISTVPYTAAGPLTIICLMLRHSAITVFAWGTIIFTPKI